MIRLTRIRRFRVSNRLAVLAACLLIGATAAGMNSPLGLQDGEFDGSLTNNHQSTVSETPRGASVGVRKGFKVSLYLFRHN